ncbi:hypothetical protein ACWGJT_08525 [Streptomyces xantholiticus]
MGLPIGACVTRLAAFDGQNALPPVFFFVLPALVAMVRRRHSRLVTLVRNRTRGPVEG